MEKGDFVKSEHRSFITRSIWSQQAVAKPSFALSSFFQFSIDSRIRVSCPWFVFVMSHFSFGFWTLTFLSITLDGYPTSPAIYAQVKRCSPKIQETSESQTLERSSVLALICGRFTSLRIVARNSLLFAPGVLGNSPLTRNSVHPILQPIENNLLPVHLINRYTQRKAR